MMGLTVTMQNGRAEPGSLYEGGKVGALSPLVERDCKKPLGLLPEPWLDVGILLEEGNCETHRLVQGVKRLKMEKTDSSSNKRPCNPSINNKDSQDDQQLEHEFARSEINFLDESG